VRNAPTDKQIEVKVSGNFVIVQRSPLSSTAGENHPLIIALLLRTKYKEVEQLLPSVTQISYGSVLQLITKPELLYR
jgi:hypothetical protein